MVEHNISKAVLSIVAVEGAAGAKVVIRNWRRRLYGSDTQQTEGLDVQDLTNDIGSLRPFSLIWQRKACRLYGCDPSSFKRKLRREAHCSVTSPEPEPHFAIAKQVMM